MKKLITLILFIFSIQIFSGQYQVTKQKNVTLSKEQIDLENKKIEETVSKYPKKVLQEMISYYFSVSNKVNNEMSKEEKESMQLLSNEFFGFFSVPCNISICSALESISKRCTSHWDNSFLKAPNIGAFCIKVCFLK